MQSGGYTSASDLSRPLKRCKGQRLYWQAKANEQGVLFGSVTAGQIAANLREQGFEVADEVVRLPEHTKQVGTHSVRLRFSEDLTATVSVVVVSEQADADIRPASAPGQDRRDEKIDGT